MNGLPRGQRRSAAQEIAACSVMTAILIAGQAVFAQVSGIEIVTVLLLTFSWSFGPKDGVLAAVAFSLLRCFLWGFHPPAIALYLLYYPAFAFLFGTFGKGSPRRFAAAQCTAANGALILLTAACAVLASTGTLKLTMLEVETIRALLWVIFALCAALLLLLNGALLLRRALPRAEALVRVIPVVALAALCTVCFTLLDDILTPLFYGIEWGSTAFVSYFYASFLALVPQTLCAIVTVGALFFPLTSAFSRIRH